MTTTILSYDKMNSVKRISENNKPFVMQLIKEVEFSKIRPLIGKEIYDKILSEIQTPDAELTQILENGLYQCITYMTYARYIQESMLVDTFTGMVVKEREDSRTASVGQLKNVANEYSQMALNYYDEVKDLINKKYGCSIKTVDTTNWSKIQGVRRTNKCANKRYKILYL